MVEVLRLQLSRFPSASASFLRLVGRDMDSCKIISVGPFNLCSLPPSLGGLTSMQRGDFS